MLLYQCSGDLISPYNVFFNFHNMLGLEKGHPFGGRITTTSSAGNLQLQKAFFTSPCLSQLQFLIASESRQQNWLILCDDWCIFFIFVVSLLLLITRDNNAIFCLVRVAIFIFDGKDIHWRYRESTFVLNTMKFLGGDFIVYIHIFQIKKFFLIWLFPDMFITIGIMKCFGKSSWAGINPILGWNMTGKNVLLMFPTRCQNTLRNQCRERERWVRGVCLIMVPSLLWTVNGHSFLTLCVNGLEEWHV